MKNSILVLVVLILATCSLNAQNGDKYFKAKEYRSAAYAYENEVADNPSKYFDLAKAYFAIQEFDKAIEALELYKEKYPKGNTELANQWLTLLKRNDEPVKPVNLGANFNTAENEITPRITQDGKRLYFSAHSRAGGKGGEDIWYTDLQPDGTWGNPVNFQELNTPSHEGILSISADGNTLLLFGNYPGSFGRGDLFYSVKTAEGWSYPCNLGGTINTGAWEAQACLAPDGKTMLFVSDRKGGQGETDIYFSQLSEKGWTVPENIGPVINSNGSEYFPQLSADGKTLYFVSTGHFGFGGRDIFTAQRLDDTWKNWSKPVNMGKYINTLEDESDFSVPASGNIAYFYRVDPKGFGKNDLMSVIIPLDLRPEKIITVYGQVTNEADSAAGVNIRYYNLDGMKEENRVSSSLDSGLYKVGLSLGKKYLVEINMKGYLYFSDTLDLSDIKKLVPRDTFKNRLSDEWAAIAQERKMLEDNLKSADAGMRSESDEIKTEFEQLTLHLANAGKHLHALTEKVNEARYRWLSEIVVIPDIERNYQLQRSSVGASFALEDIFFDLGKATLSPQSKNSLDKLYDIMAKNDIYIELGGHTDSIGSAENNLKLSQARVNSVKEYLENRGIPAVRIMATGYGESRPIADNRTEEGRKKNRRVEVVIIDRRTALEGRETELVENEEIEETTFVEKVEAKDFFETLRAAARAGGLPKGSECGEIITATSSIPKTTTTQSSPRKSVVKRPKTYDELALDEYVFGKFNLSLNNMELNKVRPEVGRTLGINMNILSDGRTETHVQYWLGGDSIRWGAGFGQLFKWQFGKYMGLPLELTFGYRADLLSLRLGDQIEFPDDLKFMLLVPLGGRYVFNFGDFKIGPELMYNLNLFASDDLGSVSHWVYGVNARWKFLHGGLYLNRGDVMQYNGFRVGLTF